jgi:cytochrome c peroxidase
LIEDAIMRRHRIIACVLVTVACALAGGTLLLTNNAKATAPPAPVRAPSQSGGNPTVTPLVFFPPLPPVPKSPNIIALSDVQQLGKDIIFDTTLSNPEGYACFQCHAPTTGGTSGLVSDVNLVAGVPPGVVPGRADHRRAMAYPYAAFSPVGPFYDAEFAMAWVGGCFWDGRVPDLSTQARQPFINPDEMNNTPTNGVYPPPAGGYSALVVEKVEKSSYAPLFKQIYGANAFTKYTIPELYTLITEAEAAYESSGEICQFSSKYDASKYGVPPGTLYTLSASEERGRQLYFGIGPKNAHCAECHSSATYPIVLATTNGKDTFTMYCFANIGVPRNYNNPFYQMTDCTSNPHGCNPLGTNFVDYGLGANPNPAPNGTVFNNSATNSQFLGLFQAATTRNVDLRPSPTFVKAYFHNGWAKSLQTVVHFYNTRNLTTQPGEVINFTLPNPYANLVGTPLWAPPEVVTNINNPQGLQSNTPGQAQVGNLGLTASQEADLVNFLRILSDGYTAPNPVGPVGVGAAADDPAPAAASKK